MHLFLLFGYLSGGANVKSNELIYECSGFVVCIKPAGILSQCGKSGEESMISLLEAQLDGTFYPVHRLDRETAGLMIYARTSAAAAELSRQIQQGHLQKEYLAVIHGTPKQPKGIFEDILFHDSRRNKSYVIKSLRKGAKRAGLCYQVLASRGDETLVQVLLLTGRTHQIRVQFASRGLPLRGDRTYGGGKGELCLWSCRLTLQTSDGKQRSFFRLPEQLGSFLEIPPLAKLAGQGNAALDEKVLDKALGVQ